jgi:pantoate--beta-alanine ligase
MIVFEKAMALQTYLDAQGATGKPIGFVPTMGALHEGHVSLLQASNRAEQFTVASIFVNPTQFNDAKDFERYPKTLDQDLGLLKANGCNALFLPSVDEIYPGGAVSKHYEIGPIEKLLEGAFRPGHFQGVCTVVDRLLEIVEPDKLFMGQKDYQQCMVISRLLELTGRTKTELVICPTLRETDGLAMSSRNLRLNKGERAKAVTISKVLQYIKKHVAVSGLREVQQAAEKMLADEGFRADYVSIADARTLRPLVNWQEEKMVALIAAFLGEVRLIDNLVLN